jgi:hypothetical protein
MDDYVVALEQAQLPPQFAGLIKYLFTEVLDGRNAYLTDGVQRALGARRGTFPSTRGAQRRAAHGRDETKMPPPWRGGGTVAAQVSEKV